MTLTETIENDLRHRIDAGDFASKSLTLASIAADYGVSLTPVRDALHRLISEAYVTKRPNGRMQVNPDRVIVSSSRPDSLNAGLDPDLQTSLMEEILVLSVRADDETYLREEASAEKYGVGRTVLRGILNRLAGSDIISHIPRRGWMVRPYSYERLKDYLKVRETLELLAIELAGENLDVDHLAELQRCNHPEREGGESRIDDRLHDYIVACSGNTYIEEFINTHGRYWSAVSNLAAPETHKVTSMAGEHVAILQALIEGDTRSAQDLLRTHIRVQGHIVEEMVGQIRAGHETEGVA